MEMAYGDRRRRLYVFFYLDEPATSIEDRVVASAQNCLLVGFVRRLAERSYEVVAEGRHDDLTRFLDALVVLPIAHRPVIHDVAWLVPLNAELRFFALRPGERPQ